MNDKIDAFAQLPDAEAQWGEFERAVRGEHRSFFDGTGAVFGARAPGRLDVIGGLADYSGSLLLEMPLAEAAFAAWQWRSDRLLRIRTAGSVAAGLAPEVSLSLELVVDELGNVRPAEYIRAQLAEDPDRHWAAYPLGCFWVMLMAHSRLTDGRADSRIGEVGANILLDSRVPIGAGVASSAAIEVAVTHALSESAGIHPSDLTLAAWCQRAESLIVGAHSGIKDQIVAALGRENGLTVLKCQPHNLLGTQHVPAGWRILGIDTCVPRSSDRTRRNRARVGAFMGLKIIQLESGGKLLDNYLCKMDPTEFATYREMLPERLTGREYRELYGQLPDTVTSVDPEQTYRPRACAEHSICENQRVQEFVGLMHIAGIHEEERGEIAGAGERPAAEPDIQLLLEAGKLMYQSHESYSGLELGSPEADLLVRLIAEKGAEHGLFGARITGSGDGGTVAVLCADRPGETDIQLAEVCAAYEHRFGVAPRPFVGSSPGAVMFGARQIDLD